MTAETMTMVEYFNGPPAVLESAPGRINLLGEHTDYNDGFVLPTATPQRTYVALDYSRDEASHLYSATLGKRVNFPRHGEAPAGFGRYIEGCIRLVEESGVEVPPLLIYVVSDVPVGLGLSSSAALEIATLRALRRLLELKFNDADIALIGQQAEIRYANVHCGIMDQMASSLADTTHMLFLDTRTLEHRLLPMPPDTELIVIDCGVARTLATSKYNERRAECEEAARRLGVPALRDISDLASLERLPELYRRRARHVINENKRVLEASEGVTAERFGALMNASHVSLRDDYEVSIVALDCLTALLRKHADVFGARLTGAGFGGACVALCRKGQANLVAEDTLEQYKNSGFHGRILMPAVIT